MRVLALLAACAALFTAQARAADPSIGSYYFFAALDTRCTEPDPARAAALEQFKQHFLTQARRVMSAFQPSQTVQARQKLEDLEKMGPSAEDLKQFDALFAKATPQDLAEACRSAAKDIAERIALEKRMAEMMGRAAPSANSSAPRGGPAAQEVPYLTPEYLERTGPPFALLSVQHFYAILKRCETVAPAPDAVAARAQAFERLLDGATTLNGLWRTFYDADGHLKETRFPSARAMAASAEFAMDLRRYEKVVATVPLDTQRTDCAEFEALVARALSRK